MSGEILEALISAGDNFDVEQHASKILQSAVSNSEITKYIEGLTEAEQKLDHEIEDHVFTHHQDLLSQATGVERLETHLSSVSSQAQTLNAALERTRTRVLEPYESVRTQTITLARLQETCDLLRRIIRILQLGKKLRAQLQGGPSEIAKAAQSLSELSELWEPEEELSGIEIIEQDQRILMHARADVEKSSDAMLLSGMESKNQNQMALALQVYFNLGVLPPKIDELISKKVSEIRTKLSENLDVKRIVAIANDTIQSSTVPTSSGPMPGRLSRSAATTTLNVSGFRSILWGNVETAFDVIYSVCCDTMQLQKILYKKRDLTGNSFFELLKNDQRNVIEVVWNRAMEVLQDCLVKGCCNSSLMKDTLEGEFPKLMRLFNDLWNRLHQAATTYLLSDPATSNSFELVNPFPKSDSGCREKTKEKVFLNYERAYLSKSLSRLFDPVNLMFSTSSRDQAYSSAFTSDQDEMREVFRIVSSELSIAQVDSHLLTAVAKNVAKTVHLMCNKSEQLLNLEVESSKYPGEDQRSNISTVNSLYAFEVGIRGCLEDSALQGRSQVQGVILESLTKVDTMIRSAVDPLMQSIRNGVEAILSTMHNEDFVEVDTSAKMSPYMKELESFASRITIEFLSNLNCKMVVAKSVVNLAEKCIDLFILHASLVRPIQSSGRARLAADCSRLQAALEPFLSIGQIRPDSPVMLRLNGLQSLLNTEAKNFPESPIVKENIVPLSISLHLLFSFGPPELKSPHESAGWTISRYIAWLDDHPEEGDRLQLIQGALEHYVASTRARREKSYAFPYPVILGLLQAAFKPEH